MEIGVSRVGFAHHDRRGPEYRHVARCWSQLTDRSGTDFRLDGARRLVGDRTRYGMAVALTTAAFAALFLLWIRGLVLVGLPRDAFIATGVAVSLGLVVAVAANFCGIPMWRS